MWQRAGYGARGAARSRSAGSALALLVCTASACLGASCSPSAQGAAAPALTVGKAGQAPARPVAEGAAPLGACPAARALPARRLSARQYINTLNDLITTSGALQPVLNEVERELSQLPEDGEAGASFPDMDTRLTPRHASTFVQVAESIASAATEKDERLAALAGACALGNELDAGCLRRFLDDFGRRAYRRPLTENETQRYLEDVNQGVSARAAFRQLLARLLAAPELLFQVEHGAGSPAANGAEALSAHELAARLSYLFWQSPPDATLAAAADSGELLEPQRYRQEVERLLRHQRARANWLRFFREWLELDHFGGFAQDRAFKSFAGEVQATPALYADAVWEIEDLVSYYSYEQPGSFADLLLSDRVLTRSLRLARLYGVTPWDGYAPPRAFAGRERSGLLTRAALLISAQHSTNPFKRGAFVRRRLLCEPLEPPKQRPAEAFVLPPFDPAASTRERFARKVSAWSCKGCHDLFTPYGYVLESYDALGRHRAEERLIDEAGVELRHVPIDAAARVLLDPGASRQVQDARGLSEALAASPAVKRCFARQYFRFSFRRNDTPADACTIDRMLQALDTGGLAHFYASVAFTDDFRQLGPAAPAEAATSPEATP